jgi:DNA-binding GntR family transcriptional regulator
MTTFPLLTKNIPLSREDFAYEAIKEAIVSGDLLPSQKISLTDLAKNLGVSIIPVNSAIGRLTSEGLIRQDPHHSPYVAEFSAKDTKEVLTIRYHMEELALREAIPFVGDEQVEFLESMLEQMDAVAEQKDFHNFGIMNRNFHMQIYSYNPMPMLNDMICDLWNKAELNRCRSVFSLVPNMTEHSQVEHHELLKMIAAKKMEEAVEVLRRHKNYSKVKLLEALEEQGA